MELELGLALPDPGPKAVGELGFLRLDGTKRGFGEAFGAEGKPTLPLFVRDNDDEDDGDHGDGSGAAHRETSNKRKRLVGWPPVKCAHRRTCGGGAAYVKVKMEGVPIGRKVDVSLHGSYDDLLRTLDRMFPPSADQQGAPAEDEAAGWRRHPYVVTYEDGEGDWLLVGDVPWEAFATSVKRLKILA
ncbi:hypothetical protein EJB05_46026, partial [Eragrostis curvula]